MTSSVTEAGAEFIPACVEAIIRKVSDNDWTFSNDKGSVAKYKTLFKC